MGPTVKGPVQDPLAVLLLDNICNYNLILRTVVCSLKQTQEKKTIIKTHRLRSKETKSQQKEREREREIKKTTDIQQEKKHKSIKKKNGQMDRWTDRHCAIKNAVNP